MISPVVVDTIAARIHARHAPAWAAVRSDAAAAKAGGWTRESVLDMVGRAEALATKQADATIAAFRPFLLPAMTTPEGRRLVNEHLGRARATIVNHLMPGGITLAKAEAVIAEAEARDAEIADTFAALVADALETDR